MTATITTLPTAESSINVGNLLPAVDNYAQAASRAKHITDNYKTVVFTVADNTAAISHTSHDYSASTILTATNTTSGVFAVDARKLNTSLKGLVGTRNKSVNCKEIHVSCTNDIATFEYDGISVHIPVVDEVIHPDSLDRCTKLATIPADVLRDVWAKVHRNCGVDDTLPMLTGLNFTFSPNLVDFSATDRFRLALVKYHTPAVVEEETKFLVPSAHFKMLDKHLKDFSGDIEIFTLDNRLVFMFDNQIIQSRPLDADFPRVQGLIPKQAQIMINCDRDNMLRTLTRLEKISGKNSNLRFTLHPERLDMNVEGNKHLNKDAPAASAPMPATVAGIERENQKVGYNITYMIDALKGFTATRVAFIMEATSRPVVIVDADGNTGEELNDLTRGGESFTVPAYDHMQLLMPVRLPG